MTNSAGFLSNYARWQPRSRTTGENAAPVRYVGQKQKLVHGMLYSQPSEPVKITEHTRAQEGDVVLTEQPAEQEQHHTIQIQFNSVWFSAVLSS